MDYIQPVLDGTSLPHISDYSETRGFRGSMVEMADGSVAFDIVNPDAKRTYTLEWINVSGTDKAAIEAAYDGLKTSSLSFTPPTGDPAVTVTRTNRDLDFAPTRAAAGLLWNVEMELREV